MQPITIEDTKDKEKVPQLLSQESILKSDGTVTFEGVHEVVDHNSSEDSHNDTQSGVSTYQYEEWHALLERSNYKYMSHYKSSRFWLVIYEMINICLIVLSSVVTANGIGDLFNKNILIVLGIAMVVCSSINTFLNPSSNYTKHNTVSKRYRELYHRTRNCDTLKIFLELQKLFETIEKEAPDTPIFMNKKAKIQYVFMHPSLQEDFKKFYTYKTNPIKFKSHSFRV